MSSERIDVNATILTKNPLILLLDLGTDGPAAGSELAAEVWALLIADVMRKYSSFNFDFVPHRFEQVRSSTGLVTMLAIAKPK